ncbi:MAG: PAS domain S-box protein [Parcubacteria group bacterium]|nr:PAS domain S-box protein [Parcubacteria group bacterium]
MKRDFFSQILYVLILGLIVVINAVWFLPISASLRDRISDVEAEAVRRAGSSISFFLDGKIIELEIPARNFKKNLHDPENGEIARKILSGEGFSRVTVVDAEGNEIFKYDKFKLVLPSDFGNVSELPEFREIARTRRPVFGRVAISESFEPVAIVGVPVLTPDGRMNGALMAELRIRSALEIIGSVKTPHSGKVYIVDGEGALIADKDISLVLKNPDYSSRAIVAAVLKEKKTVFSADDKYSYVNEGGIEVLAAGEYVAKTGWGVIVEESRSEALKTINMARVFLLIAVLLGAFLVYILRKINSDLARSREELSKTLVSTRLLSDVLKKASQAWGMSDLEGNMIDANDAFSDLTGYSGEEIKKMKNVDFFDPDSAKEVKNRIENALATGNPFSADAKFTVKDGSKTAVHIIVNAYRDNGRPKYLYAFVTDISEEKKREEELAARNADLERLNEVMVGRELRMVELKKEIAELKEEIKNKK